MTLPQGWAQHPSDPQWAYELANPQNLQPMSAFTQAPAAAAPAAPQQPAPHDLPQGMQAADMNVEAWLQQQEQQARATLGFSSGADKNTIWVDFGSIENVGDESLLTVRVIPDAVNNDQRDLCVPTSEHRVFAEYVPGDTGNRQVFYVTCWNNIGGPGDCPICDALQKAATSQVPGVAEHLSNLKPRTTYCWKVILLDDPTKHYIEDHDEAGNPKKDNAGNPIYKAVPGILRAKKTLFDAMLEVIRRKGNPAHLQHGYSMLLSKRKTGKANNEVKYGATDQNRGPLDPQLYPILQNDIDLRKEVLTDRFWSAEKMRGIADNILAKAGMPAAPAPSQGEGYVPHPSASGYEYNPNTGAVRPVQAAPHPAPPSAPSPQPQAPPQPPQAPPSPPAQPPAPPAPPAGLPPAAAPGLGQQQQQGGVMPPPPPPPGMPAGAQPQQPPAPPQGQQLPAPPSPPQGPGQPPPPPPAQGQGQAPPPPPAQGGNQAPAPPPAPAQGQQPQGVTPEQLEAQFGGGGQGGQGNIPF